MKRLIFALVIVTILSLTVGRAALEPPVQAQATPDLPAAEIVNDEGGPERLVGSADYSDFSLPLIMQSPAPALLDMVHEISGDTMQFAPLESQILGYMTSPVSPSPLSYAFNLPQTPTGTFVDVDNDGAVNPGVQIYQLAMAANVNGGSYLEQLDQESGLNSYLTDPISGDITEGSLLIFAADDDQGFPAGFGEDGVLFTGDDPVVAVPQGYSVVRLEEDGFIFDRAREAQMDVLEYAAQESPDFSAQGIVESYNSLVDHLAEHYSFTELRGLDWEAIRAEYLPLVEEAEGLAAENPDLATAAYVSILHRLAQSLVDAHVEAVITDETQLVAAGQAEVIQNLPISMNIGANTAVLDDGRVILTDVVDGSPAAEAGLVFGSELVSVNGNPVAEVLPTVLYNENTGTPGGQRLYQAANLLKFPGADANGEISDVVIEVVRPGEAQPQSLSVTPGEFDLPYRLSSAARTMPISFEMTPHYGYLSWDAFLSPDVRMAVLEEFLSEVANQPNMNGVILDLRGNSGGWDILYLTMASYFTDPDNPFSTHWIDQDVYDAEVGDFVREAPWAYEISPPQSELAYTGPLVILVDNNCASACEFFAQFLQRNGRASVVSQYSTKGAGAPINRVAMPGGITFQYTKGRAYFADTDELNLEGKGVTADVLVPVTEESEQAKLAGEDFLMAAGFAELAQLQVRAFVEAVVMQPLAGHETRGYTAVIPEDWTFNDKLKAYVSPDGQYSLSYVQTTEAAGDELLAKLGITDPQAALLETRAANDLDWSIYGAEQDGFSYRTAVTQAGDESSVMQMIAPTANVDMVQPAILDAAIDAFALVAEDVKAALPEELASQLDASLENQLWTEGADPTTSAPGLVLLVDTPDGRYLHAAGVSSLEQGTPMEVDDRFEIGSNSKSFTIALLMQLQEEGILSLDDSLSAWLPEWAAKIPHGEEMTLRQLAQHTSGIWDYGDPIIGQAATNPVHLEDYDSPQQLVQYAIDNGTPDFEPGAEGQWNYSNTGYILLGMVIEAASGENLGDLYQSRIFDPLGLESAVFIEDVPEPHEIVDGYYWLDDGQKLNTTNWNVSQGWAAGGLAMTVEDLLAYGQALSAGELFQDPDSLAQMLDFDPDGMGGLMPYGLGLMDFSLAGAPGYWGHEGQTAGFQTLWYTNPETDVTVVGLSNSANYSAFSFLHIASLLAEQPGE